MSVVTGSPVLPSIALHWVKNNLLAAVLSSGVSLVLFGLRQATGAADADADVAGFAIQYVAAICLWAFYGAASGVLTGAVLQRIVPRLPVWTWILLHVAGAVIIGVINEMTQTGSVRDRPAANDETVLAVLLLGAILGALLGAVSGGLEALVLRRAASGTVSWIAWSAIAFAVGWSLLSVSLRMAELGNDFPGQLAGEALSFVATLIMTLLMLPALRRLKSPTLSGAAQHFT
jgi:uncharacterized membrane protein YdcZ (DUF606 family)